MKPIEKLEVVVRAAQGGAFSELVRDYCRTASESAEALVIRRTVAAIEEILGAPLAKKWQPRFVEAALWPYWPAKLAINSRSFGARAAAAIRGQR